VRGESRILFDQGLYHLRINQVADVALALGAQSCRESWSRLGMLTGGANASESPYLWSGFVIVAETLSA
jgi:hypothetical protein